LCLKSITREEAEKLPFDDLFLGLQKLLTIINESPVRAGLKIKEQNVCNRSYFILVNEFNRRIFGIPHWQRLDRGFFIDVLDHARKVIHVYHPELKQVKLSSP